MGPRIPTISTIMYSVILGTSFDTLSTESGLCICGNIAKFGIEVMTAVMTAVIVMTTVIVIVVMIMTAVIVMTTVM